MGAANSEPIQPFMPAGRCGGVECGAEARLCAVQCSAHALVRVPTPDDAMVHVPRTQLHGGAAHGCQRSGRSVVSAAHPHPISLLALP